MDSRITQLHFNSTTISVCQIIDENKFYVIDFLTDNDVDRLATIKNQSRRNERLTTRWLLKQMIPNNEGIIYNGNGKPFLRNSTSEISISHSSQLVAIAINTSGKPIGIDCETISDRVLKIIHKFASHQEQEFCNLMKTECYTLLWSTKEALYKLIDEPGVDFIKNLQVDTFAYNTEGGTFTSKYINQTERFFNITFVTIHNNIISLATEQ